MKEKYSIATKVIVIKNALSIIPGLRECMGAYVCVSARVREGRYRIMCIINVRVVLTRCHIILDIPTL